MGTFLSTSVCLKFSIIQGLPVCFFRQNQVNQRGKELNQILLYFFLKYLLLKHNCLHPSTLKVIQVHNVLGEWV